MRPLHYIPIDTDNGFIREGWGGITRLAAILLLLILPMGCETLGVPAPQTPREQLVAAEAQYQTVVGTVTDMLRSGTITAQQFGRADAAITAARRALDSAHMNPDTRDSLTGALIAIRAAQVIVDGMKGASP